MAIRLQGVAASPGVVIGEVFLISPVKLVINKVEISREDVPKELARFERALAKTTEDIIALRKKVAREIDEEHAHILDAHLLILEDALLIEETIKEVQKKKLNVDYVFSQVVENLAASFEAIDDLYIKQRVSDIRDVGRRILRNILGKKRRSLSHLERQSIVIAHDLSPSDTAQMYKEKVTAFATDIGARTSHSAIMARSLEIPAVVGLKDITGKAVHGGTAVIDGNKGVVIIKPDEETLKHYRDERVRFKTSERRLRKLKDLPAETKDGHRVIVAANMEMPDEIPSILEHGAEGIGLYRTEFFYLNRSDLPTEEEHYKAYRQVAEKISPHSVIIRTLDLGGDKFLSHLDFPREMNPFLGWRAIRFCLERPDIFKVQLRAIMRASAHGNLKMMFPLISSLEELKKAKEMLEEVKGELRKGGFPYDENMKVGAMIETPSAAVIADILSREVDFFSIGTNDLIQYSLAVDRVNEKIADLYEPTHLAILRLIRTIVDSGHKAGIWVAMCGEMAGEVALAPLLLGLGLDQLSMSPVALPKVKEIIRSISFEDARKLAEEAFTFSTGREIERFMKRRMGEISPGVVKKTTLETG